MSTETIILSPTLAANEKVQALRAAGRHVYHMGFGQAPFPVHPRLKEALAKYADQQQYLSVAGLPELCEAVLQHQQTLTGIDATQYDVIVGPGSKLILYALQMAIEGDIMLPVPSWVSYAPQAKLLGQSVVPVPTVDQDNTLKLTRENLEAAFVSARSEGMSPTKLLINFPGNPTGITITDADLQEITEFCLKHKVTLISDEIYGRLAFDGQYRTASSHYPSGAIVTTGLSKHLSLGGWRLGVGIIPKAMTGLHRKLVHIASETWSCVSTPVQYAAIEAYRLHDDVEQYIDQCRQIHQIVNTHIADKLRACGFTCPTPKGAFYTWPDFKKADSTLDFTTSTQLADYLLNKHGIVSLPGNAFGESDDIMRLRLSGCDYDGAAALSLFNARGSDYIGQNLHEMAPNVTGALAQFEQFASLD